MQNAVESVRKDTESVKLSSRRVANFWDRVEKTPDGCWIWKKRKTKDGYGDSGYSYNRGLRLTHRISWTIHNGPIPDDLCVLHSCDNPPCCNPAHLFLGTQQNNIADMVKKRRQAMGDSHGSRVHPEKLSRGDKHYSRLNPEKLARGDRHGSRTHPEKIKKGEDLGCAKLNSDSVIEIRRLWNEEKVTFYRLGKMFGISEEHAMRVARRRSWKHLA